jgi:hypothetical protein
MGRKLVRHACGAVAQAGLMYSSLVPAQESRAFWNGSDAR